MSENEESFRVLRRDPARRSRRKGAGSRGSESRRTSWRKKISSWATSEVQEFTWSELKFQVTEVLCQWSWYTEEHDVFKVPRESLSLGKVETQSESSEIDKVWNKQDCVKNLWFINK